MKKIFLFCLLLSTVLTFAQGTKKVAILETVDRENALSYGVKLMVRSYLSEAVTNTFGYEAYDRTDLQQIFNEQDFQRTGNVSDEEIKRIGKMTGAQYVLVTEASKLDERNLFITSKILNVETARVEKTANTTSQTDIPSMQKCAQDLASRLLADIRPNKETSSIEPTDGVYIERISAHEYSIGGKWVNRIAYYKFIKQNRIQCIPAYQEFLKGGTLTTAGWSLLGVGTGLVAPGVALFVGCAVAHSRPLDHGEAVAGVCLMVVGSACWLTSIPLLSVGYHKKDNVYKLYNEYCGSKKTASAVTLNLQTSSNGLGLALHF